MSKTTTPKPNNKSRQAWLLMVNLGLLLIVTSTALPLFHVFGLPVKIIFSVGAVMVTAGRLFGCNTKGASLRVRRLSHLEVWTGIIFCVGAFFMWYTPERTDWLAFTLAGAALQVYTSIVLPKAIAKEHKVKNN